MEVNKAMGVGARLAEQPVTVVIATAGGRKLTSCLKLLFEQTYSNFEIIVVGPITKETLDFNSEDLGRISVISSEEHSAGARNIGIEKARGRIVAFIDDDAIADTRWLEELVKSYALSDVAGVRGKVVPLTPGKLFNDLIFTKHYDLGNEIKTVKSEFGLGCNMSLRKAILKEVGGFDPALRWGHEEYELSLRLIKAGKKLVYNPNAVVYHDYAKSLRHLVKKRFILGFKLAYVMVKHKLRYGFKRIPASLFFPALILSLILSSTIVGIGFLIVLSLLLFLRLGIMTTRTQKFQIAIIATFIDLIRDFGLLLGNIWYTLLRLVK